MNNQAQLALKEPETINWDQYESGGGKYTPPPPAKGGDGKAILYSGQLPTSLTPEAYTQTNEGYRQYVIDPIKIVKSANGAYDGYTLRFTRVSVKPFMGKDGKPKNASAVGNLIKSVGLTAKPNKNAEYDAAIKLALGKVATFSIDWEARNKETGETVRGYDSFPDDPARPGQKKAILRASDGDQYKNEDGVWVPVTSEVLFANARVQWFNAPSSKK